MGWWSEDIMGGDTPLDIQGLMFEAAGLTDDEGLDIFAAQEYPKDLATRLYKAMPAIIKTYKHFDKYDSSVWYQVAATVVMRAGMPVTDNRIKGLLKMAIRQAPKDEWALEDPNGPRAEKINELIEKIMAYLGNS